MKIYLVGGAVRDELLGFPVQERDWLVVGGSEAMLLEQGFCRADSEFPVFLHPDTGEEYALARTETKSGSGYKGFVVHAGPDVTLEQDLVRRDLTVNALARDEAGKVVDLFDGQTDLEQKRLRHISPAFVEDPLRLLRAARFAAYLDFTVAPETVELMRQIAHSGELSTLNRERVWKELVAALQGQAPWRFFEVLLECGALAPLHLALSHQAESIESLQRVVKATPSTEVRLAAVMYRTVAHSGGVEDLHDFLPLPTGHSWLLNALQQHARDLEQAAAGDAEALLALLTQLRAQQQPERYAQFLQAANAIWPELMQKAAVNLEQAMQVINSVTAADLQDQGLNGKELGEELTALRLQEIRMAIGS